MSDRGIGDKLEKWWVKKLAEAEGGRARQTVASGAIFGDEDVCSDIHVSQCKATSLPAKTLSISLKEFDSVLSRARSEWRRDGRGMKVGILVQQRVDGQVIVSLDADDYLDLIKELSDYRQAIDEISNTVTEKGEY
jgi:hypothetical protein